ncbi:hypothetical protein N2152v2_003429 [Parachlorella kessleri]
MRTLYIDSYIQSPASCAADDATAAATQKGFVFRNRQGKFPETYKGVQLSSLIDTARVTGKAPGVGCSEQQRVVNWFLNLHSLQGGSSKRLSSLEKRFEGYKKVLVSEDKLTYFLERNHKAIEELQLDAEVFARDASPFSQAAKDALKQEVEAQDTVWPLYEQLAKELPTISLLAEKARQRETEISTWRRQITRQAGKEQAAAEAEAEKQRGEVKLILAAGSGEVDAKVGEILEVQRKLTTKSKKTAFEVTVRSTGARGKVLASKTEPYHSPRKPEPEVCDLVTDDESSDDLATDDEEGEAVGASLREALTDLLDGNKASQMPRSSLGPAVQLGANFDLQQQQQQPPSGIPGPSRPRDASQPGAGFPPQQHHHQDLQGLRTGQCATLRGALRERGRLASQDAPQLDAMRPESAAEQLGPASEHEGPASAPASPQHAAAVAEVPYAKFCAENQEAFKRWPTYKDQTIEHLMAFRAILDRVKAEAEGRSARQKLRWDLMGCVKEKERKLNDIIKRHMANHYSSFWMGQRKWKK